PYVTHKRGRSERETRNKREAKRTSEGNTCEKEKREETGRDRIISINISWMSLLLWYVYSNALCWGSNESATTAYADDVSKPWLWMSTTRNVWKLHVSSNGTRDIYAAYVPGTSSNEWWISCASTYDARRNVSSSGATFSWINKSHEWILI